MTRPDPRPAEVVWSFFEKSFEAGGYPSVSWALGSDWGVGSRVLTPEEYKSAAYKLMTTIYGPNPSVRS